MLILLYLLLPEGCGVGHLVCFFEGIGPVNEDLFYPDHRFLDLLGMQIWLAGLPKMLENSTPFQCPRRAVVARSQ
jgi:hypothetical protein